MLLALLTTLALAADEPEIISVPSGSTITIGARSPQRIDYQAYLLPEKHYDRCLITAQNLPICKEALTFCQERSEWVMSEALNTFELARAQFNHDETVVVEQAQKIVELDLSMGEAQETIKRVRNQRNVAWAITGGLVLGAVATTAVAIGS